MPVNQVSGSGVNEVMLAKNGQNLQNSQFWPIFVIKNPLKIKSKQDRTLNNPWLPYIHKAQYDLPLRQPITDLWTFETHF